MRVTSQERTEIAVDNLVLHAIMPTRVAGPPYKVEFVVNHSDEWPAMMLDIVIAGQPAISLITDEPRLRMLATWLANEVS